MLLNGLVDSLLFLLKSCGLLFLALLLSLLDCLKSLVGLCGLSGVDLSDSLVGSLDDFLLLLLDILIYGFINY